MSNPKYTNFSEQERFMLHNDTLFNTFGVELQHKNGCEIHISVVLFTIHIYIYLDASQRMFTHNNNNLHIQ